MFALFPLKHGDPRLSWFRPVELTFGWERSLNLRFALNLRFRSVTRGGPYFRWLLG